MSQPVYLPAVLLSAVVGMGVAFLAWLSRDKPGARPLALLLGAASFWAVAEGLRIASPQPMSLFWVGAGLVLSTAVPLAWLFTVAEYTGLEEWLDARWAALLLVEPVAFTALVLTNGRHGLVWPGAGEVAIGGFTSATIVPGAGLWLHEGYSLALVAAGAVLLAGLFVRAEEGYRIRSLAILLGIAVAAATDAAVAARALPPGLDPSGPGYVFAGIVTAAAMFRRDLFSLAPVTRELGREAAIADVADPIVTIDDENRIVDLNAAAEAVLGRSRADCLDRDIHAVLPDGGALDEGSELRLERDGEVRYFDVAVSDLYRGYGAFTGRLITLRDVTERRRREQRLDVLNRLLRHNLRNELNVVKGKIQLAAEASTDGVAEPLADASGKIDAILRRSDKIGALSRTLESDAEGPVDLARLLRADADVSRPAVTIDLPDPLPVEAGPSLAVAFAELVENAVEHNDGDPTVRIAVDEARSDGAYVVVAISDDGPGIDPGEWEVVVEGEETPLRHASGIGLWLANWTVERFGGTLAFENTGQGCTVRVRLPRADGVPTPDDPVLDRDRERRSADPPQSSP